MEAIEDVYKSEYVKIPDSFVLEKNKTDEVSGKRIVISVKMKRNNYGCFINGEEYISSGLKTDISGKHSDSSCEAEIITITKK